MQLKIIMPGWLRIIRGLIITLLGLSLALLKVHYSIVLIIALFGVIVFLLDRGGKLSLNPIKILKRYFP